MTPGTAARRHLGHVARGGALGLVGALVSAISGFVLVVVVTRGLAPHDAGLFFSATAAFLMLLSIASLGTDTGLARFLLRLHADGRVADIRHVTRTALWTVLAASAATGVALVLFAGPVSDVLGWKSDGGSLAVLFAVALPVAVLADFALSGTRAFARMRPTVLVDRLFRAGAQAVVALVVVVSGGGVTALTAAWLVPYAVAAALAVLALRRMTRAVLAADGPLTAGPPGGRERDGRPRVVREFWLFTWPRGLTRLAQIGIQKGDIIIVAAMLSPRHAAVYTAATRFVALGQFATQALQQVLQPRFTAILVHEDRATLREVYRVATAWNVLLTWPVYLVIGCAPSAYLSIFGDGYATAPDAALVVVVMMLAMLAAVASGPVDTLLLMAGRSGRSLANATAALVLDLGLCLLLVPRLGIAGAALAWAVAVLTRCGLAYVQVRAELRIVPTGRPFAAAVAACVGAVGLPMAFASVMGLRSLVTWLVIATALAVAYLAVLVAWRRVLRLDLLTAAIRGERDPAAPELAGVRHAAPEPNLARQPSVEEPCA